MVIFFFFNDTATTEIYTLSLHDALPIFGPFMGQGHFVTITDYGTGKPYTSTTPLVTGEIGEDLAYYLTESEQTPSAVGLNVLLDQEDKVKVAGGFMLQVLPGASDEEISRDRKSVV